MPEPERVATAAKPAAAAVPTGELREYRCLANVSKGGKMHDIGSTIELTESQARPILQHLEEL